MGDPRYATVAINSTGIETANQVGGGTRPAVAPWADMLYAADCSFWHHYQAALKFPGLKVTASENPYPAVFILRNTGNEGYDPTPGTIRTGGNSAYQALHIAVQAGATRVLLCGVDLHMRNGSHHHGDHPGKLRNPSQPDLKNMITRFRSLVEPMRKMGIEVLNCSTDSDLDAFPKIGIEEALS